jgi:hypothetical protein
MDQHADFRDPYYSPISSTPLIPRPHSLSMYSPILSHTSTPPQTTCNNGAPNVDDAMGTLSDLPVEPASGATTDHYHGKTLLTLDVLYAWCRIL